MSENGRIEIKIDFLPVVAVLGIILGMLAGGIIGGAKGFAYAVTLYLAAGFLSLLPVLGPVATWFWAMPLLKEAIGVGSEMFAVDIIVIILSVVENIFVTIILLAIVASIIWD